MNRYNKSPQRTYSAKPQFIGTCVMQENEKTYVVSLLQKLYKSSGSSQERESLQKGVSEELCRQFKKSVGVSVIEGDESYLTNGNFAVKREPSGTILHNGLLIRLWVREDDIRSQNNHFRD